MDRVYQIELEILYSLLPSLLNNSRNSFQELSGKVLYLTASKVSKVVMSELSVDWNLEPLYLSVLGFEYKT